MKPLAADLFGDVDLQCCCPTLRVERYPQGLIDALRKIDHSWQLGRTPWMVTGALENQPDLVEQMAAEWPLYGNSVEVLRSVRDPARLADALSAGGFLYPQTLLGVDQWVGVGQRTGQHPKTGERQAGEMWLRKPRLGSGGGGIVVCSDVVCNDVVCGDRANKNGAAQHALRPSHYMQQRIEGTPSSAVYVAAGSACRLLGVTQQMIGTAWAGASGFQYAGSVGPLDVGEPLWRSLDALGRHLSQHFRLVGLFGVDAILCGDQLWVIEVNPRYTASIEILERALGIRAVAEHVSACRDGRLLAEVPVTMPVASAGPTAPCHGKSCHGKPCHGKVILYAKRETVVPEAFLQYAQQSNADSSWPSVADIPAAGSCIRAGWPIVTLFASAANEREVLATMRAEAEAMCGRFFA